MYGKPDKSGRLPKIPLDPNEQSAADKDRPETWGTFEEAMHRYRSCSPKEDGTFTVEGVGFMLTEHDPFFCIDVDFKHLAKDHPARKEWYRNVVLVR
jgi:primase-polymerase (primpol)-like protein